MKLLEYVLSALFCSAGLFAAEMPTKVEEAHMKFCIVGISLEQKFNDLPREAVCKEVAKRFPEIISKVSQAYGDEFITVIVLQEYAFTPKSISTITKKECISLLRNAIKDFENLILIPGSFANHQAINLSQKLEILQNNYAVLNALSQYREDAQFKNEFLNHMDKINKPLEDYIYIENSTYFLTSCYKMKHKKCFPWYERTRLPAEMQDKSVFYIGADNPLRTVVLGKNTCDIAVLICREHADTPKTNFKEAAPLLQVIISDSVDVKVNNFYSPLVIHMDSQSKLSVFLNKFHPKAGAISAVVATNYIISSSPAEIFLDHVEVKNYQPIDSIRHLKWLSAPTFDKHKKDIISLLQQNNIFVTQRLESKLDQEYANKLSGILRVLKNLEAAGVLSEPNLNSVLNSVENIANIAFGMEWFKKHSNWREYPQEHFIAIVKNASFDGKQFMQFFQANKKTFQLSAIQERPNCACSQVCRDSFFV